MHANESQRRKLVTDKTINFKGTNPHLTNLDSIDDRFQRYWYQ